MKLYDLITFNTNGYLELVTDNYNTLKSARQEAVRHASGTPIYIVSIDRMTTLIDNDGTLDLDTITEPMIKKIATTVVY